MTSIILDTSAFVDCANLLACLFLIKIVSFVKQDERKQERELCDHCQQCNRLDDEGAFLISCCQGDHASHVKLEGVQDEVAENWIVEHLELEVFYSLLPLV